MNEDGWLFAIVFAVWLALAIVYAAVPMFSMPGYAVVWGWGALGVPRSRRASRTGCAPRAAAAQFAPLSNAAGLCRSRLRLPGP